ncbi:MAG: metal-dependent hydrolase [Bacillota bacterium]
MSNRIRWFGHSFFEIITGDDRTILIDPFLEDNPLIPEGVVPEKADLILTTHDHFDHLESIESLLAPEGMIAGQPEVLQKIKNEHEGLKDINFINQGMGMNIGGTIEVDGLKITMVQAFHSSEVGSPCGFVLTLPDGKTIYHAGDTGVFSSMELIGELYNLNLALLPIGSVFTMDPRQASIAVRLLKPEVVIPMHYGTFPVLVESADEFVRLAGHQYAEAEIKPLNPGDSCTI